MSRFSGSLVLATLLGSAAILTSAGEVYAAGYLKIGDIKGESLDANHEGWITLDSVSFSRNSPSLTAARGQRQCTGSAGPGEMRVLRSIGRATPRIQQAARGAPPYNEIILDDAPGTVDEVQYVLRNVRVSAAPAGGEVPTEEVTFTYQEIEWTYSSCGGTGTAAGNVNEVGIAPQRATTGAASGAPVQNRGAAERDR